MSAVRAGLPEGRYGRSADERADRKLKIIGAVLGAGLIALIAWFGYAYVVDQDVSGQLTGFKVTSDDTVDVRLEITKDKDATAVCTVRTLDTYHEEVGRKSFTFDQRQDDMIKVVTVRTTARATSAELIGCDSAANS
ncbi:DUF4307 domain-containing protein [Streptomyces botrytidirepellens]|uniref:DUF4307 domain-containing protein n=1 Tax=Streptomyces botrytidirepellens TaxID=2486417 RepID=A0A3M8VT62_9ACTN|nr:DUF4307 domain-containing protein [Streptomyces botrytidirepellens]RNG20347.1 DUF4307 domain-containing protein [Streptomyces botrytidirepellens]